MSHHNLPPVPPEFSEFVTGLQKKVANQAERIRYLEGATNHATGTPLSLEREARQRLEHDVREFLQLIREWGFTPFVFSPLVRDNMTELMKKHPNLKPQ